MSKAATAKRQERDVALTGREKKAVRGRELREYRIAQRLCVDCGKPREDETRTRCQRCASRRASRYAAHTREKRQHRIAQGLCERCREPRGEGVTGTMCTRCANNDRAHKREREQRLISEGRCKHCGEPRGEDGTKYRCRPCADREAARAHKKHLQRIEQRLCVYCGEPLGTNETGRLCANCVVRRAANWAKARRYRIESSICPQHGEAMPMLDPCPACRYEAPGGKLSDLTFDGLLPRPSSGDKLETCVGCKRCGRTYHKGISYYAPIPHLGVKLKDEHIGEEGNGMWLLFSQADDEGVPVIYERCSTPDQKCVGKIARAVARNYLAEHRRGKKRLGVCKRHGVSPTLFAEVVEARLRHQLDATAQPQTGNGQANGNDKKERKARFDVTKFINNYRASVCALWDRTHSVDACANAKALLVELQDRGEEITTYQGLTGRFPRAGFEGSLTDIAVAILLKERPNFRGVKSER